MPRLGDLVEKIRSKNAGPFWITLDVFCGTPAAYERVCEALSTQEVAGAFGVPVSEVKRFDIADLNVVKFSIPRPVVQGGRFDRDMHGAQWALKLSGLEVET
ncbi:MAG: DUF4387 domain-containing protein [Paracoccaceae bacterium]